MSCRLEIILMRIQSLRLLCLCCSYGCVVHLSKFSFLLQLGAIGVWTYVYMIMRMSATKCKGEINLCNSTTSVRTSREALEISSDCCTEALLPPRDSPRSGNWSDEEELPHDGSEEKSEVFPGFTLNINVIVYMYLFLNFCYGSLFSGSFWRLFFWYTKKVHKNSSVRW